MSRSSILWFNRSTATRTARVPCSSIRLRANASTLAGIQAALWGLSPIHTRNQCRCIVKHQFYGKILSSYETLNSCYSCSGIRCRSDAEEDSSMLGNPSDPAPNTVLVVEDNELNLKLLNDLLEYQGYRVIATRLGEPVLGLAQQYKPDLILMDIQLPDISGME